MPARWSSSACSEVSSAASSAAWSRWCCASSGGGERGRSVCRLDQRGAGPQPDLGRVRVVRGGGGAGEQVRGDHLRHLLLDTLECLLQRRDRGQMAGLAISA